jgi:hypothetical protein
MTVHTVECETRTCNSIFLRGHGFPFPRSIGKGTLSLRATLLEGNAPQS